MTFLINQMPICEGRYLINCIIITRQIHGGVSWEKVPKLECGAKHLAHILKFELHYILIL